MTRPEETTVYYRVLSDEEKLSEITRILEVPVVLVGMMGSGKTRLGKMLAARLNLDFYDSDQEVEKAAGCTIPEIFERFGERAFRDGEKRVVRRLLENGPCVIASGGGTMMNPETAHIVWEGSVSIWLKAELDLLMKRLNGVQDRPLLKEKDPQAVLEDLLLKRNPIYARSSLTVETGDIPPEDTLSAMLENLYMFLSGRGHHENA